MKKRIPLLLLSMLFVVGCNENPTNDSSTNIPSENGNKSENVDNDNNQNIGDNQEDSSKDDNEEDNNEDNSENNNDNDGGSTGSNEVSGYTVNYQTYGENFQNTLPKRTQLTGASNSGNVAKLETFFKENTLYDDILTGLEFAGYVQSLDADQEIVYLCLGSSSQEGAMGWTSTRKILKVECTVINYYKTYTAYVDGQAVPGVTSDSMVHFKIDDEDNSMELTESLVPEEKTFSVFYGNEGTDSFSIASVGGRVLVKSISVTWKL